ncbi:sulfur carrier protein ThiS adenylyltransferase ThiF [bacterium]|nr:sulfur carrier protein ThiS adenylyltransferase ThiF [bacterium]
MVQSSTEDTIFERNVPGSTEILIRTTVAIAGCGGLGSNAAVALTRAGVGRFILVDSDRVELSNLNRQHFFRTDLGRPKVHALAAHLRAINPAIQLTLHFQRLQRNDVPSLFAEADLLLEAFDRAEDKKWLIEEWCQFYQDRYVICASGIAGIGKTESLKIRRAGTIVLCGDEHSDMTQGLCAARVGIVANTQANLALELLINRGKT